MSIAGGIRRLATDLSYPAAALLYRSVPKGNSPIALLKLLGIADPAYRSDFYTLHELVRRVARQGGTIAECGVYLGSTLLGMANELQRLGAADWHIIGFDSFAGFPEPAAQDALPDGTYHARTRRGVFNDASYEGLSRRIKALGFVDRITLVKGYFENTLAAWPREYSLVHLDCDLYDSYRTCMAFFYPRLRPGGFMVFDEYDFSAGVYPGAQRAIDEFFADKPEQIRRLPDAVTPRYFIAKA